MRQILLVIPLLATYCSFSFGQASQPRSNAPEAEEVVIAADDEFQQAKVKNDVAALERILAENFYETNQNGNSRNKAETIELFRKFPIKSLIRDAAQVRLTGNTAIVTGLQTEQNASGTDRMLFMRVWVRDNARWQLAGSMQYRNPKQ